MNRENWLKNIEGAVFDLDGTLLDSSWVWEKVDEKFLGDRGFQVPDDYVDEISPLGAERAAVYTIERFGLNEDKDDIVREWIEMAKKEYATEVVCKPYAKEFLEELHKLNIKMAVATSSDRELFMKTLEREGILKYFQKIVTVDEVERGKGYPDIYEEAARRIKVNPHKCPSRAPFNPFGNVGYISSSVIAPEKGLAEHISFTSISNSFASLSAKSNRILESF